MPWRRASWSMRLVNSALTSSGKSGGWCRAMDDWRYFLILDDDGAPATMHLTQGKHRVRMERVTGSMNVDVLVWEATGN